MAKAEISDVLPVSKAALFKVITDYSKYPEFVDGMIKAQIKDKQGAVSKVYYEVNMMKEIHYTIEIKEDESKGVVQWSLIESDIFKMNNGLWKIEQNGVNSCKVNYSLEVEFKIPVPGFILNKLVKGSLPSMIKGFKERAKTHG